MRVLLINPPGVCHQTELPISSYPPLGLGYMAAVLERNGFVVRILDAALGSFVQANGCLLRYGLSDEEIERNLLEFNPSLIGISASFSSSIEYAHLLATQAKRLLPTTSVIVGGIHASVLPQEMLRNSAISAVVIGEGELTFLEIAKCLKENLDFRAIEGIAIRSNAKNKDSEDYQIIFNKARSLIRDIDSLPYPARHLFADTSLYNKNLMRDNFCKKAPIVSMITSRGCVYACTFCSFRTVFSGSWRMRAVGSVINEIEYLIKTYGAKEIHFQDDNMNIDKKRMIFLCDELLRRKIKIAWVAPNGLSLASLDEEVLTKMKGSGCYRIGIGIESGCQRTLEFINKRIDLNYAKRIFHFANTIGLWTQACFVIGLPYESKDDILQTLEYAISLGADISIFNIATPYCGTRLRKIVEEEGLYQPGAYLSPQQVSCASKYLSKEEIKLLADRCFDMSIRNRVKSYLKHPSIILRKPDIGYTGRLFLRFLVVVQNKLRDDTFSFVGLKKKYCES